MVLHFYEFRLIYCDEWKKIPRLPSGTCFICPSAYCRFLKPPADRMIQCCTVAQSLSIYFLPSIALWFWCWMESGALLHFVKNTALCFILPKKKKMLILLRFVIELQGSALLFEFAYNNSLIVIISYQRHNNLWLGKEEVDKGSLHLFSNLPTFFFFC